MLYREGSFSLIYVKTALANRSSAALTGKRRGASDVKQLIADVLRQLNISA
jgi:hypothetical protein